MSLRTRSALVASATLLLAACGEDPATAPVAAPRGAVVASALKNDRLATVEWEGRFPALYLQNADGKERVRVRFENVHDKIEGNWPADFLPVTDDRIIAMSNPKWSPDGQQLALVVSVAFDQSEVVVMNADGRQIRTESVNGQIIMGDVDWSPDSRKIAYVMSTQNHARGVDLFVTDLVTEKVQRITTDGRFGAWDQYRWDPTGTGLWYSQWESWGDDGWNRVARVYHATLTGQVDGVPEKAIGDLQAISRDGQWAYTVRYTPRGQQEFVRMPLGKGEEQVIARGEFMYARLLEGDDELVIVGYNPTGAPSYMRYGALDGEPRGRLSMNASVSSFGYIRAGR